MQLESLPNELLLELFGYIDGVNLICGFYYLNSRFNNLLLLYHKNIHFDFRNISKPLFNIICQQCLSTFIDQITSIKLSDDLNTRNISNHFISYGFHLNQFKHLKFLSLYSINSIDKLISPTSQALHLPNLTHLNLIKCSIFTNSNTHSSFLNHIWSLPKLTHCKLDGNNSIEQYLLNISTISFSIKNLFIEDCLCDSQTLFYLLKYTPNLRRCHTVFSGDTQDLYFQTMTSSLISLHISFHGLHINYIISIFQNISNLYYLTIETSTIHWNGYQWQDILVKYILQIKLFRFKMENFIQNEYIDIDQLLDSFRTSFWLEQHRWYVRCQWNPHSSDKVLTIYTLPYAFTRMYYKHDWYFKSTCLNEKQYSSYDCVQFFLDYSNNNIFWNEFNFSDLFFSNIRNLKIIDPDQFKLYSWYSSLNHLVSLNVTIKYIWHYDFLQQLLDRTPRLYSLVLNIYCELSKELFQLTNLSVRQLYISVGPKTYYFNNKDCEHLINSPLGLQCEFLTVNIKNCIDIVNLIEQMSNLRSIAFQCEDKIMKYNENKDNLIRWLQKHLPSTCSINRNDSSGLIEIWIGSQTKEKSPFKIKNKDSYRHLTLFKKLIFSKK
ncbi:unnamed protein product [Adineta steineri]|uniref:F-box domain-containing protein n=1 Tax=Adineta steineri TaxID=433720 RepID=A0A818UK83_9BILA|nr:unnamed protein product [Adineta steineri]CAF3699195.1 unnamed protein product [Adineta steineri]